MTPVNFWERAVTGPPAHIGTSGLRPTFDPQHDPTDTYRSPRPRFRDADGHDYARSEQAVNPFGEDIPGLLHPDDLPTVTAATYPAALTARPSTGAVSSSAAPVDGRAPLSDDEQPGRGHDRAA